MLNEELKGIINSYQDFPKAGINFKDISPILKNQKLFSIVIKNMASSVICQEADAILAIDARGFLFGGPIAFQMSKPLIIARKPGKLPGKLITNKYNLEYGSNSLSIQKDAIKEFNSFVIVDDLLATGGTVKCVSDMLNNEGKKISGLEVVIELKDLCGRKSFNFGVNSQITF